jgi:hypothetical protein
MALIDGTQVETCDGKIAPQNGQIGLSVDCGVDG